jgi:hypothetical protein
MNEAINELEFAIMVLGIKKSHAEENARYWNPTGRYSRGFDDGKVSGIQEAIEVLQRHIQSLKLNPKPSIVHDRP